MKPGAEMKILRLENKRLRELAESRKTRNQALEAEIGELQMDIQTACKKCREAPQ